MEERNYWYRTFQRRISRRRALQLAALTAGGAAVAAACGGGEEGEEKPVPREGGPGEVINPQPQEIVPGGIWRGWIPQDPLNLDPMRNLSFTTDLFVSGFVYSRLYKYKVEPGYESTLYDSVPDAAESFEATPDLLTWTFKLRPGMKFHDKPPVNGHSLTSEDVKVTFERFLELPARYEIVLRPVVDRVETPDDQTVVFHLKIPYAPFLNTVTAATYLWILPREVATGDVDPTQEAGVIGSGPWILESFQPSVALKYRKNPEWYGAPLPYLDGWILNVIPEYASRLAQFQAGNLDTFSPNANDLLSVVNSVPDAQVSQGGFPNVLNFMFFDYGVNSNSPFKDERVRRAVSMAMDRDSLLEALYNLSILRNAGYSPQARWHNALPGGLSRWWLDPKSPEMGEAGGWYQFDPAEARKLIQAALGTDTIDSELHFATGIYGTTYESGAEAIVPFLREAGVNPQAKAENYVEWITTTFPGDVKGMAYALETVFSEADEYLFHMYHPDGARNHSKVDDPELTAMIEEQRVETDLEKRKEIVNNIQRHVSDRMYYVPLIVFGATDFDTLQPWVRNVGVYNAASFGGGTEGAVWTGLAEDAPGRNISL